MEKKDTRRPPEREKERNGDGRVKKKARNFGRSGGGEGGRARFLVTIVKKNQFLELSLGVVLL